MTTRPTRPCLVLVTGSGRSGTSSITGILKLLGLHVPQPEAGATRSNPKGHFEPRWVLDFHKALLSRAHVRLSDARPSAFGETARVGSAPDAQRTLQTWLRSELTTEVIIKDPRSSWFIPMWQEAAAAVDVPIRFLTMLRHPAEVAGSKHAYYYRRVPAQERRIVETSRVAGWVNIALSSELATRDRPRVFVRYTDVLSDWRAVVSDLASTLGLSLREGLDPARAAEVDTFVDPDLHRIKATWDTLEIPMPLQDLAEETWLQLSRLGDDSAPHTPSGRETLDALDELRSSYERMYDEAYALAHSSMVASTRRGVKARKAGLPPTPRSRRLARGAVRRGRRLARRALRLAQRAGFAARPRATG